MLERLFKLKQNNTTVKTEVLAGFTSFVTMAYILAVNPLHLSEAGMNPNAVLIATALSAFIGTMLMAFLANYPFALAPGMGLNTFFAYTVCITMGFSWQVALLAVFVEGIIFILLSLTNVREAIFNSIPMSLKHAVSVGIGLFIAFIGLQGAKIVIPNSATLVSYQNYKENFTTDGISAILAIIGIIITAVLVVKKVKGNILIGILSTWFLGMICQAIGLYEGLSLYPDFSNGLHLNSIGETFMQAFAVDFSSIRIVDFIIVVFAFLFVDLFDTLGTLIGVASKSNMLDKDGKLPRIKGALLADSLATCAGAVLGTSTTTTYVESSAGVSEGGKTGLTAFTTAILFFLAIFLSPIFVAIPSFATAPALVVVGFYMLSAVTHIDFSDMSDAIPAFLCIIAMPFTYSIAEGISFGVISYTFINVLSGKKQRSKISFLMYILTVLFIAKYIILTFV